MSCPNTSLHSTVPRISALVPENQETPQITDRPQFAKVSSDCPVWHCRNALKYGETCVYTLCSECHEDIVGGTNQHQRRNKRRHRPDEDDDITGCNHLHLECCTDPSYFSASYLQGMKDNKEHYPQVCAGNHCGLPFRS